MSIVRRQWPLFVVGLLIASYILYFGWYTIHSSEYYPFGGFDLAIYDQTVWNTAHGRWFHSTYQPGMDSLLADHVEPILLPISLLYWLWQSPKMLLLIQTIALALGALPVYWLARDGLQAAVANDLSPGIETTNRPGNPAPARWVQVAAVVFALVYLLFPPLHATNTYEFHPSALVIPFLLYAFHFMRHQRTILFFVFVLLAMSTKETLPLTTLALGIYLVIIRRELRLGAITMLASLAWLFLSMFVIIPHFNPEGQSIYLASGYYGWLGDSSSEILTQLITRPDLILRRVVERTSPAYLTGLLGPVAYFSLLNPAVLLLAIPALVLNALSDAPLQHSIGSYLHYAAPYIPFIIVAAIDGACFLAHHLGRLGAKIPPRRLRATEPRVLALGLVCLLALGASSIAQIRHGYLPFSRDYYVTDEPELAAALKALAQQAPTEASVSVDRRLAPHFSQRTDLLLYPDQTEARFQAIDLSFLDWPTHPRDRYDLIQRLLQESEYGVRDGRSGYLLLEQGLNQPTIPNRFYDFVWPDKPSPDYEMAVDFGDELRLIGFDLVRERPVVPRAYLVLYWQALHPIDRDLRIFAFQTDPSGEVLPGTELEFAEPVWYPPSRWTPSDVIRTKTFHWALSEPSDFGVAIGVVEGAGLWEMNSRLRPEIQSAPWDLHLSQDGTLLWPISLHIADRFVTFRTPEGQALR